MPFLLIVYRKMRGGKLYLMTCTRQSSDCLRFLGGPEEEEEEGEEEEGGEVLRRPQEGAAQEQGLEGRAFFIRWPLALATLV